MVTKRAGFVSRHALAEHGEPCEQQRESVGSVVTGVRQQCETMGADAGRNLNGDKRGGGH